MVKHKMRRTSQSNLLDLESLTVKVNKGEINTVLVAFPDPYGRLMGKRVTANFFLDSVAKHGTHVCDYLLTADMDMVPVQGYQVANWSKGYGDFKCVPDVSTLRPIAWLDRSALVMCDLFSERDHKVVDLAPRTVLKHQLEHLNSAGYYAKAASELEYYLFRETYDSVKEKGFEDLQTFGWYIEDYHLLQGTKEEVFNSTVRTRLAASGIPVESSKGEWGPGQHEINLAYADPLEMADRHSLYKQAAKEIAIQLGFAVTFMAKWRSDLAGSSMHLHLSLWDKRSNKPLFHTKQRSGKIHMSDEFRWFLGGWMRHAREITAFYAPYPTSYKRYVARSWAPTKLAWGFDNRTAAFRILGADNSLRIECRIPGADANPYLAFAASIAAGLAGIRKNIEPPEPFAGDVYASQNLESVAMSLREAADVLEKSNMLNEAFGRSVIEHYVHFFRTEQAIFDSVVTSWERARYFERC